MNRPANMHPALKLYACSVLILAVFFLALIGFASAHEGHRLTNPTYKEQGRFSQSGQYLYGINRDRTASTFGQTVNCCKYGGDGDCQILPVEHVKIVAGGYEVDGEFIPEAETTASPDDGYYRCQHAGKPSHCLFVPPQGF